MPGSRFSRCAPRSAWPCWRARHGGGCAEPEGLPIFTFRSRARRRVGGCLEFLVTQEATMDQPSRSLTGCAGIGLRSEHYVEFIESRPPVGFIEVHSENYFGRGGKPLHFLK